MPTRNVVLTEHQEFISQLVGSGRYRNTSEVLRESLRLMERRETLETAKSMTYGPNWTRPKAMSPQADWWRSRPACWRP